MATDLSISVRDEPGGLAGVAEALGSAGVNVEGLAGLGGGGAGHIHLLVDDVAGARSALQGAGFTVEAEREAVVVDASGEDRPGTLGELTRKAADAGVNLTACYAATRSRLVFVADDAAALRSALGA
jgi:hypothetical protein